MSFLKHQSQGRAREKRCIDLRYLTFKNEDKMDFAWTWTYITAKFHFIHIPQITFYLQISIYLQIRTRRGSYSDSVHMGYGSGSSELY